MPKNILITGARGFIGKNLVEYLGKNFPAEYILFYPYHKELDLLDSDKVFQFINDNKIEVIIHGASVGGSRKTGYDAGKTDVVSQNLRMFFNLARCLNGNRQLINFGSGAEYDLRYYQPKMSEEYFDKHVPADAYGFSKYVILKYIENSRNMVNLRLFGVFGKYEDFEFKFISNAIVKNLLGLPIAINQNVFFDYIYVNDLLKMVAAFIDKTPKYKNYNAVCGKTIDLASIAHKINQIASKPSEIIIKNPGLNTEYSASNQRILSKLKTFEFTPFEVALRELYHYYQQNLSKIDRSVIEKDECIKYCRTKEV
ncbi:MAG: NAD-dependent epimerase/dehydratase family protein [Candidatus Margulisbacteria bacterium]|nr:NAD-dependent epimerase/dehydratase family protein [Candidatus Margulisiibacteriota bacterium]